MNVVKYSGSYKDQWNDFIKKSANGCFLHDRNFMEYHADRFQDHSLMIFEGEELVACFPAHSADKVLISHRGLTYAGVIASEKAELYQRILQTIKLHCLQQNFEHLEFKLPPKFYDPLLDERLKILSSEGFNESSVSTDLYIDLRQDWSPSPKKTAGYRNGKFEELERIIDTEFKSFWSELLIPQLKERHDAEPVHSLVEIELLHSRFPNHIQQCYVQLGGKKIAGITLFDFENILKVQYAAANDVGFEKNAMDFLYLEIIKQARDQGKQFVDLGTVNNPDGTINRGLQRFKKQLGASVTPVIEIALDLRP